MRLINYSFKTLNVSLDIPNIYYLTYYILINVSKGKVTTYGDIAELLGDKIASRAVGRLMAINKYPNEIPCYKVVHSDGKVGKYSGIDGVQGKIRRLRDDGVEVEGGFIKDFAKHREKLNEKLVFPYLKSLRNLQNHLSKKVKLNNYLELDKVRYVVATDVAYVDGYPDIGIGGAILYDTKENFSVKSVSISFIPIYFPYIPTFLAFREAPPLLAAIDNLLELTGINPDVYMFDGHGVLHPRGFGLATHMGVLLNKPSIGVAKSILVGKALSEIKTVNEKAYQKVLVNKQYYGFKVWIKGREKNAIYVSPGHLINHTSALKIILSTKWVNGKYQMMFSAHRLVTYFRKKLLEMLG
ncbi:MAG: endonuclease V [Candidatus Njordarchaeia archaeon]